MQRGSTHKLSILLRWLMDNTWLGATARGGWAVGGLFDSAVEPRTQHKTKHKQMKMKHTQTHTHAYTRLSARTFVCVLESG